MVQEPDGCTENIQKIQEPSFQTECNHVRTGPELDAEQCNYAKKHGLTPNILCTGPLSHAQLEALYCISSALIFLLAMKALGSLEAQRCGCPVIASSNGSLNEVIGDSAPTSEWDDIKSHVEALSNILLDENCRQSLLIEDSRTSKDSVPR